MESDIRLIDANAALRDIRNRMDGARIPKDDPTAEIVIDAIMNARTYRKPKDVQRKQAADFERIIREEVTCGDYITESNEAFRDWVRTAVRDHDNSKQILQAIEYVKSDLDRIKYGDPADVIISHEIRRK